MRKRHFPSVLVLANALPDHFERRKENCKLRDVSDEGGDKSLEIGLKTSFLVDLLHTVKTVFVFVRQPGELHLHGALNNFGGACNERLGESCNHSSSECVFERNFVSLMDLH